MQMGSVVSKAWKTAFRHKALWVYGFILTHIGMMNFMLGKRETVFQEQINNILQNTGLMALLIISGLVLWMLFVFLMLISEGALVYGVWRSSKDEMPGFKDLFLKGLGFFGKMLGINIAVWLPLLFLWILFLVTMIVSLFRLAGIHEGNYLAAAFLYFFLFIVFIVMILITITVGIVNNLTKRFAVIGEYGVFSSIGHAVKLLFGKTGKVLKLYFTALGLYLLITLGFISISLVVTAPLNFIDFGGGPQRTIASFLLLVPIYLVLRIIGGIATVFISSLWTLGFLSLQEAETSGSEKQTGGTDDTGIGAQ